MKITDITGKIENGMWNYEPPFPKFDLTPLPQPEWVDSKVYCEIFTGMHSQTGTYIETPAHFYGNDNSYLMGDVDVSKLFDIPCTLLMLDGLSDIKSERQPITSDMLKSCSAEIEQGDAILVGTGWGQHWSHKSYLNASPYFTRGAMEYLISKKPFILGTDFPRWENLEKPQGLFPIFYSANILMLAPLVNLEKIKSHKAHLTALPINVAGTSCIPCRAVIREDV